MTEFSRDIDNFLNAKSSAGNAYGKQDPLFLTFLVQFDFVSDKLEGATYDNIGANFLNKFKADSTIETYYSEIKGWETGRKAYNIHKYFKNSLYDIENKTPWFFKSITGLERLLQYKETSAYWGGDDAIITIDCLENMSMQVSNLMHAYRKSIWDTESWSWIVPDNLRKFNVVIWATDARRSDGTRERHWFKFTLQDCEFMLDSGNGAFSDLQSSPVEPINQSIVIKYENAYVESLINLKYGDNDEPQEESAFLKERFKDEELYVDGELAENIDAPDVDDNLFGIKNPTDKFLSKAWIDRKNREITDRLKGGVDREWNNFQRDYKNKAIDTARGLVNSGIRSLEEEIGNKIGFDNFRLNPSSLANNVIKGLGDLSDRKSREAINSLIGSSRKIEPLATDENVYGNLQQVLDSALDRKLEGYNNFVGSNPSSPGPLGPENVYDPE